MIDQTINISGTRKIERIAFDLDDTAVKFRGPFLKFYNERNGTNFTLSQITNYALHVSLGVPGDFVQSEINAFYSTPQFYSAPLFSEARYVAKVLSKKCPIGVITARPDYVADATKAHVSKLSGDIENIHFTNQFGGNSKERKKSAHCLSQGYGAIVEDSIEYANECAEAGVLAFLLPRPWNLSYHNLHPNIRRIRNLRDLLTQPELAV